MADYTKHVWASGELITSTLLNHIEDQLALTAPAATTIAAVYDNSKYYLKDEYCLYDGQLWRALVPTNAHAPAEGTYWTAATVGEDLNKIFSGVDVLEKMQPLIYSGHIRSGYIDTSTNGIWHDSTSYYHVILPVNSGASIYVQSNNSYQAIIAGLTAKDTPVEGELASFSTQTGWTLTNTIATGDSYNGRIPDDVKYLYVMLGSASYPRMPLSLIIDGYDYVKDLYDNFIDIKHNIDNVINSDKANIDGNYSGLTAGSAEQLLASSGEWDKVPYNLRATGGSVNAGSRVKEKIVGGSVVWNQIAKNSIAPSSRNGMTITGDDSGFTIDGTASAATTMSGWFGLDSVYPQYMATNGHKMFISLKLISGSITPASGNTLTIYFKYTSGADDLQIESNKIITATIGSTSASSRSYIDVASGTVFTNAKISLNCIDLTQMFGTTIADYVYGLETANAGAGVAWFKNLFPKSYYPYNSGEMMSVKTSAHKTSGKNLFNKNATSTDNGYQMNAYLNYTGDFSNSSNYDISEYIPVKPGFYYTASGITGSNPSICFYDVNKIFQYGGKYNSWTARSLEAASNIRYCRISVPHATVDSLQLEQGDVATDYESYTEHVYPLDSDLELRGIPKLDGGNNLYYDGDTYESDGTVTRRYGIVDLGTLAWQKNTSTAITVGYTFSAHVPGYLCYPGRNRIISRPYTQYRQNGLSNIVAANGAGIDKVLFNTASAISDVLYIIDSAYSTVEEFTAGMSGVYFVYELDTPTTESADPYQNPQIVDDFGTEEYVDDRTVPIPVGHESFYMTDLKKKIELLPDIPSAPTANGTYVLKCTVANGIPTFAWQSA